jgi:hypothetical protein
VELERRSSRLEVEAIRNGYMRLLKWSDDELLSEVVQLGKMCRE